ncbi:MAG: ComEC/Rec2 family competence protein [Planctomycetota bacterium]
MLNRLPDRHPMVVLLAPYAAGIVTGYLAGPLPWPGITAAVTVAAALAALAAMRLGRRRAHLLLLAALLPAGILNVHLALYVTAPDAIGRLADTGMPVAVRGRVGTCPITVPENGNSRMTVAVLACDTGTGWHSASGRLFAYFEGAAMPPEPGDTIVFTAAILAMKTPRNPGEEGLSRNQRLQRIQGTVFLDRDGFAIQSRSPLRSIPFRARRALSARFADLYGDTAPLMASLMLDIRDGITDEQWDWFRGSGTAHVLAVSGLNAALLVAIAGLALVVVGLPLGPRTVGTLLAAAAYTVLCGGQVAVVRTVLMVGVYLGARLLWRRAVGYNTLAAAALLILAWDPLQFFTVGFVLSFGAVLALMAATPVISAILEPPPPRGAAALLPPPPAVVFARKWARDALAVSTAAWLGTVPLVALFFGQVTPYAVIANLFVIPLVAVIMVTGFVVLLTAFIPWVAVIPAAVGAIMGRALLAAVHFFRDLPGAIQPVPRFPVMLYIGMAVVIIVAHHRGWLADRRARIGALLLAAVITLAATLMLQPRPAGPELDILDVGHGDCAIIRTSEALVMVDTGSARRGLTVVRYLEQAGIQRIDAVVISHWDEDHAGNLPLLMRRFKVQNLIVPRNEAGDGSFPGYALAAAAQNGVNIIPAATAQTLTIGGITVETLTPARPFFFPANDRSLVCKVRAGERTVLFTGDIDAAGTRMLLDEKPDLACDILKLPHHGRSEGCPELLQACPAALVLLTQDEADRVQTVATGQALAASGRRYYSTADGGFARIPLTGPLRVEAYLKHGE